MNFTELNHRRLVAEKPARPLTVRSLVEQFATFGREKWMVTMVPVEGGYQFHVHPTYEFKESRVVKAEKSKQNRVFKSIESGLNLARRFGFSSVVVELKPVSDMPLRHSSISPHLVNEDS